MLKIDHPQVYIYSYQLTRESQTQANKSIWVWANNIWEHFSQDPPPIPPQENPNHILSKAKKFSHSQKIEGSLRFCRLDDSEGILARIGSPETDENLALEITELEIFNPNNLILADSYEDWLGQTIFITYKSKPYQKPSKNDLRQVADECLKHLLPNASSRPPFYRATELFDSHIFEYSSLQSQLQVFVYRVDDDIEKQLNSILQPVFELFYHRHKINKAFIDSRLTRDLAHNSYRKIEKIIEDLETKLVVKQDRYLHELKTNVKLLLQNCLDYQRILQTLEDFDNTISIQVYNYQQKLSEIIEKCQLQPEELTTFSLFIEKTSPYFQRQIKGDLGYFQHGTNLIETAIASIRGIVEIEQAERDRQLENTIQAVGTGIGVGIGFAGILASSYPLIEKPWQLPSPQHPLLLPHPFFIAITLSCLLGGGLGWLAWWITRKRLK
jgi:hypothetical protein